VTVEKPIAKRAAKSGKPKRTRFSVALRERLARIARELERFYASGGRRFPWRDETDPYRIAVSEILLQKTRASSVPETYGMLVSMYRDAKSLGAAESAVLARILTPLGLYRKRARQLIAMGKELSSDNAPSLSEWEHSLRYVPGLGKYSARAVACFAFAQRVGIVDANVARILRRAFSIRDRDLRAPVFQRYADALAVSVDDPQALNYGLLDLGAMICTRAPKCQICPIADECDYRNLRL
jgi:A/G-specific adenine glycosylase